MTVRSDALKQIIRTNLDALCSDDKDVQGKAFQHLLAMTAEPVDWAYGAWDELLDPCVTRTIAAGLLRPRFSAILPRATRSREWWVTFLRC